jgi:hypothetical protein
MSEAIKLIKNKNFEGCDRIPQRILIKEISNTHSGSNSTVYKIISAEVPSRTVALCKKSCPYPRKVINQR